MTRIVLTAEQSQILVRATEPVEICDPEGKILCQLKPAFTEEEIALALQGAKSSGPLVSSEQVRETLKTLQGIWDKEGPFDQERLKKILDGIRAFEDVIVIFTVLYSSEAEAILAELWMLGPDRGDITWAQSQVDQILANNPFQGIEVREGLFGLVVYPLKVFFEISVMDRIVKVTAIGKLKQ